MIMGRYRLAVVLGAVVLAVVGSVGPTTAQLPVGPELVGAWTSPFEEGGAATPRCSTGTDGRVTCKPVAVSSVVLPDGRVLYINGVESSENVQYGWLPEAGIEFRNSRARVLDLRTGRPRWTVPVPEDGGGTNPAIQPGNSGGASDPFGTAGIPGRPGEGLVGSTVGRLAPHEPSNPPDDTAANDVDFFCADATSLPDGRILIAGGSDFYNEPSIAEGRDPAGMPIGIVEVEGLRTSRIFDPTTDTFTPAGPMKYGRWYPSLVELANGRVLVAGGVTKLIKASQLSNVRRTETYDPGTDRWTENFTGPASENSLPLLPRLHLMPNGKVLFAGTGAAWNPGGQAADEATWALQQLFDPQTKQWEIAGLAPLGARSSASEVLLPLEPPYDRATVLTFGGTLGPTPGGHLATPFATLTTVDENGKLTNRRTGSLHHGRWFPSGVLLPDGTVMTVNGADRDELHTPGLEIAIRTPELYDPNTGAWTMLADQARDRTYHSSAVLLGDGRVLVGGHSPAALFYGTQRSMGGPFANNDKDPSFEVYSPPYLFRGRRPVIRGAPAGISWGHTFPIRTPDAGEIESVVLVRLPSAQHAIDSDQRGVRLAFGRQGEVLSAVAPPSGTVAPPGAYYLFINRKSPKGPIPSVARIVFLKAAGSDNEALQPFANDASPPTGSATGPGKSRFVRGLGTAPRRP